MHTNLHTCIDFLMDFALRSLAINKFTKVYRMLCVLIKSSCVHRILMGFTNIRTICNSRRRSQNAFGYHENSVNSVWPHEYLYMFTFFSFLSCFQLLLFLRTRIDLHVLSMICGVYCASQLRKWKCLECWSIESIAFARSKKLFRTNNGNQTN